MLVNVRKGLFLVQPQSKVMKSYVGYKGVYAFFSYYLRYPTELELPIKYLILLQGYSCPVMNNQTMTELFLPHQVQSLVPLFK
jgi:hypothetical protein